MVQIRHKQARSYKEEHASKRLTYTNIEKLLNLLHNRAMIAYYPHKVTLKIPFHVV